VRGVASGGGSVVPLRLRRPCRRREAEGNRISVRRGWFRCLGPRVGLPGGGGKARFAPPGGISFLRPPPRAGGICLDGGGGPVRLYRCSGSSAASAPAGGGGDLRFGGRRSVLWAASLVVGLRWRSKSGRMDRWLQIECFFPTWSARRIRSGIRVPARGTSPVDVPHRQRLRRVRRASTSTLKASDGDGAASAPARMDVCACRPPRPFFVFLFLLGCFLQFLLGSCLLPASLDVSACMCVILWFG
jgi:hypothetical protein